MKQTGSRAVQDGLKYIRATYGFLLERGYEVLSAEDADLGWQVVLGRSNLFVSVLHSRGDDYVSLRTAAQPPDEFIDIGSVVYAATGEKIPLYGSDPEKLQKYLDRVESYFAGEYIRNPDSLRAAWKAYREPVYKVEPLIPEESKRIPILYYPLLGMVLLLLFGALTTLYAVLLMRLFSAFSPETDSYALFVGIAAVLLAIGTLILIRKWVKFVG